MPKEPRRKKITNARNTANPLQHKPTKPGAAILLEEEEQAFNSFREDEEVALDESDVEEDFDDEEFMENGGEDVQLTQAEEDSLSMFMPTSSSERRTLADIIMQKIAEKQTQSNTGASGSSAPATTLEPKVISVYKEVGKYLSHYSSGKIPKAFKIIPNLKNWDEIMFLTSPEEWSAQAVNAATRLFISNLAPKLAQKYLEYVLLPRVRNDLSSHANLNFHLYDALRRSLYKPAAFFRGIVLPLVEEGCSPREAVIISSILSKFSIPWEHSAAALLKLVELPYSGPGCLIIKTLLAKKYSLPLRVIAGLASYFIGFTKDERKMPLIWHQALLTFVQRYKFELSENQRHSILALIKTQTHHGGISQEVRRELSAASTAQKIQATPQSMMI